MAILVTGNTFADGDQVTSTKLNNIANAATFASGAVDGITTTLTGGGAIQVGTIQTGNIAANAVTTAKIADAVDSSTGVTDTKLRHSSARSILGRSAATSGAPADIAAANDHEVLRRSGTTIGFGQLTPSSMTQWMTQGTSVTASGTSVDFTSLPSWIKRVTVLLNGVSLSGTALLRFQLGISSGFVTTGYTTTSWSYDATFGDKIQQQSAGFEVYEFSPSAGDLYYGRIVFENITGNTWIGTGDLCQAATTIYKSSGSIALASALTQLRVTSSNGTDTFDAGTINIIYE